MRRVCALVALTLTALTGCSSMIPENAVEVESITPERPAPEVVDPNDEFVSTAELQLVANGAVVKQDDVDRIAENACTLAFASYQRDAWRVALADVHTDVALAERLANQACADLINGLA